MCSQHDLGPVMGYQRLDERDVSTEGSPDSGDKPSKFRQLNPELMGGHENFFEVVRS